MACRGFVPAPDAHSVMCLSKPLQGLMQNRGIDAQWVLPVGVRVGCPLTLGRRTGKKMTDEFLVGEVATLFMAGFETTGARSLV